MSKTKPDSSEHSRWWIDKKLDDIRFFNQRQLQLVAFSLLLISIVVPNKERELEPFTGFLLSFIFGSALLLLYIYLDFSWPRAVRDNDKTLEKVLHENMDDLTKYVNVLQDSLETKSEKMKLSYVTFAINIASLLLLGIMDGLT